MAALVPRAEGIAVGLLGPVTLSVDGQSRVMGGVRRRAVLAVLAASAGAPVPAEQLREAVWSDTGTPSSRGTLQVHVHQLRQVLEPYADLLRHTPAGYRLDGAAVDVRTAEDRLRRARTADRAGDPAAAAAGYRAGLALWRGEFCADLCDLEYFRAARALYGTVRLDAQEAAIAAGLRVGTSGLAIELEGLVERHPLRERLWGQLMIALYRDGRQAEALGAYRRAREVLAAEVGLDPGAALRHLEGAILQQASTTELLRSVAPDGARTGRRPSLTWLDAEGVARSRELPPSGQVVIGRSDSADIALSWDAAVSRRHAVVVAEGTVSVRDLGSRNGTFHNGLRLDGQAPLRPGDLLRCGDTALAVDGPRRPGGTPSVFDDTRTGNT